MLLFTEEKTRHETMIRKQFIKINRHGKVSLNGKKITGVNLKPDISGAIFTLSLSILILNSQCIESARDVRVL